MLKFLLSSLLFFVFQLSLAQSDAIFCQQISALKTVVKENHYQPKTINDSLSKGVFNLFLKGIDQEKNFLLASDISNLSSDEDKLDDFLNATDCNFISKYTTLLEQRILESKAILEQLRNLEIDYSGSLTLQYTPEKEQTHFKDQTALQIGLKKRVAYKVIDKLLDKHQDIDYVKANFSSLENEIKNDIIISELCRLEELSNASGGIDRFVKDAFINAFLKYHDPHSTFFNPTEKQIYEDGLSSNQLSFGIITDKNNDGKVIIVAIVPGSSAFKNGNFEVNDTVISLTSNDITLETTCVSQEDIQAFTRNQAHKTISFLVKKKNGTLQNITITKSKIKVEDNAIRGYLLGDENGLGYIKIPSFYTNDESPNGRGLTSDFAKELYKLQRQNIKGLVIDLRFNGGGSMQEAIELTGMFIDRGPVTIIENNIKDTFTIKDFKRGTFFNEPIVVLVNNFSASASEFFASAMQDYNRALIVGSTTHGKASAQTIIPLDQNNPIGFCKITIEKFYRVTGKSHQAIGVIPNIGLPSIYDNIKSGEQFYDYALKQSNVAVSLAPKVLPSIKTETIKASQQARLLNNTAFNSIKKNNKDFIKSLYSKGEKYNLTIENIAKKNKEREKLFNTIFKENTSKMITVSNTNSTEELLSYNEDEKELNNQIIEELSKDIYISETFNILQDLIKLNNQ